MEFFNSIIIKDNLILDRSMHSLLTRNLLSLYLNHCNNESQSQFIFTTHDLLLIDLTLLRIDEIWITERDRYGSLSLFSFSDYEDIDKEKDIRQTYLSGRMGGIPRIILSQIL